MKAILLAQNSNKPSKISIAREKHKTSVKKVPSAPHKQKELQTKLNVRPNPLLQFRLYCHFAILRSVALMPIPAI